MEKRRIYTRSGDAGTTSLADGRRIMKSDARVEAYGTMDELDCVLGLLATYLEPAEAAFVGEVQARFVDICASLATAYASAAEVRVLPQEWIDELEQAIDRLDGPLPERHAFTIPGGGRAAAVAHVCRAVCRRAERRVVALAQEAVVDGQIPAYLNRLSDYLHVLALSLRFDNFKAAKK